MGEVSQLPVKTESKEVLQKKLKQTIKAIDKRLSELTRGNGTVGGYQWKSPGNFKMNELDSNNINILTCQDLTYLIKALGLMRRIKKEYEQTAKEEGLTKYPVCPWLGYPVDSWITDLEVRVRIVGNQGLINELNATRGKLVTHLSEEEKLSATLLETLELLKQ